MATTVNTVKASGLFKAADIELTPITANATEVELVADLSDNKDPVIAIVDLPDSGEVTLECVFTGGKTAAVPLAPEKLNVIHLTTFGLINEQGMATFKLKTATGTTLSAVAPAIGFVKYTPVENH